MNPNEFDVNVLIRVFRVTDWSKKPASEEPRLKAGTVEAVA